jgi:hypothetical protein
MRHTYNMCLLDIHMHEYPSYKVVILERTDNRVRHRTEGHLVDRVALAIRPKSTTYRRECRSRTICPSLVICMVGLVESTFCEKACLDLRSDIC